ncbi:MAG: nicotinate-nucleotide--dimethylbenzimidazole phosphoribosyltransferase [Lachnospiraceae bacterium]|nr:nicotinate-nucleotide--dimethylbenzimidazole phosphoribosyltransferase [Lachnospiraceae bacterium]
MNYEELIKVKVDKPLETARDLARLRLDDIAKPIDGLGSLETLLCRIAAIRRTPDFDMDKKALVIMCADNGVVGEGVTQTDSSVTARVAGLMGKRASSVGVMCSSYPVDIYAVDIGIDSEDKTEGVIDKKIRQGTGNIAETDAMTADECLDAINTGIDLVRDLAGDGYSLIATGEMGIGNTTTSTAVLCALLGLRAREVTGRGAGLDDERLERKIGVIEKALERHAHGRNMRVGTGFTEGSLTTGSSTDGNLKAGNFAAEGVTPEYAFEALRSLGGLDIAGLTGVFIGGALYHIPAIVDGLISAVAALCAEVLVPGCRDYMIASHVGKEKGCAIVLDRLGLKGIIDADLALGEGSGAVLLMPLLDMAYLLYRNGTRFGADAGIDNYERFDH